MAQTKAPHVRKYREDKSVLGVIYNPDHREGLSTKELAKACGRDYINNVNKRAYRWYDHLQKWVKRVRIGKEDYWYPRYPKKTPTQVKAEWDREYAK